MFASASRLCDIKSAYSSVLEHDPEKACAGLNPGSKRVFGKEHAQTRTYNNAGSLGESRAAQARQDIRRQGPRQSRRTRNRAKVCARVAAHPDRTRPL